MKIGFIGCGNMGSALASAAIKAVGSKDIYVSDFLPEKAKEFCSSTGANASSNEEIAKECDYIFLGVKPQVMDKTIDEINHIWKNRVDDFTVVSMAAGLSIDAIEKMIGAEVPVIRIMPNTPCKVGEGVVLYTTNEKVSALKAEAFEKILSKCGTVDCIPENLIDAASAVSGCGPAFVYLFIEALSDGGVCCGLPRDKALSYASQMVKGAAEMVLRTNMHPGELKDAVCSPGGTTIEGVKALEDGAFRASAMEAVIAAYEKTLKLKA